MRGQNRGRGKGGGKGRGKNGGKESGKGRRGKQGEDQSSEQVLYKVEKILGKKFLYNKFWYEVQWENSEEATWEPVDNIFDGCFHLIQQFEGVVPKANDGQTTEQTHNTTEDSSDSTNVIETVITGTIGKTIDKTIDEALDTNIGGINNSMSSGQVASDVSANPNELSSERCGQCGGQTDTSVINENATEVRDQSLTDIDDSQVASEVNTSSESAQTGTQNPSKGRVIDSFDMESDEEHQYDFDEPEDELIILSDDEESRDAKSDNKDNTVGGLDELPDSKTPFEDEARSGQPLTETQVLDSATSPIKTLVDPVLNTSSNESIGSSVNDITKASQKSNRSKQQMSECTTKGKMSKVPDPSSDLEVSTDLEKELLKSTLNDNEVTDEEIIIEDVIVRRSSSKDESNEVDRATAAINAMSTKDNKSRSKDLSHFVPQKKAHDKESNKLRVSDKEAKNEERVNNSKKPKSRKKSTEQTKTRHDSRPKPLNTRDVSVSTDDTKALNNKGLKNKEPKEPKQVDTRFTGFRTDVKVDRILGAYRIDGHLYHSVLWSDGLPSYVFAEDMNIRCPQIVIGYYESICRIKEPTPVYRPGPLSKSPWPRKKLSKSN